MKLHIYLTILLFLTIAKSNAQSYTPYQQTYSLHDFTSTPVAGSGATPNFNLQIQNNTITLGFNSGYSYYFTSTTLKTGAIKQIYTTDVLPNVVLGKLRLASGVETSYQISIENNWIVVSSNTNESITDIFGVSTLSAALGTSTGGISTLFTPGNENYVRITESQKAVKGSIKHLAEGVLQTVSYFDGLGKAKQNTQLGASVTKKDIVTHLEYDARGNKVKDYMPYATSQQNGAFIANAQNATINYYNTPNYEFTTNPYSEKIVDNSPLNQVLEIAAPGIPWKYDASKVAQTTNTVNYQKTFDNSTLILNKWPNYIQNFDSSQFLKDSSPSEGLITLSLRDGYLLDLKMTLSSNFTAMDLKTGDIGDIYGIKLPDFCFGNIPYSNGVRSMLYLCIVQNKLVISSPASREEVFNIGFNYTYTVDLNTLNSLSYSTSTIPLNYNTRNSSNNTIKTESSTNTENEVGYFNVKYTNGNTASPQLERNKTYQKNQLYKTITKTENWQPTQTNIKDNTTEEFTDKNGRVVLKRTYDNNIAHDTYYVYDYLGNLSYVLPPNAIAEMLNKSQVNDYNEIIATSNVSGGGSITTTISDTMLTLNFSAGFSPANIKEGKSVLLNSNPKLPNMFVGKLDCINEDGTKTTDLYDVSIVDGYINFKINSALPQKIIGFNEVLKVDGIIATEIIPSFNTYDTYLNTNPILNNLCYQYKYDGKNRLVEKKIPGKGWEYIVYDKLNRPILTQDAVLRTSNKWLFSKYDAYSRVVYTGDYINNTQISRETIQALADARIVQNEKKQTTFTALNGVNLYYTNNTFPNSLITLNTVNYYDNYVFDTKSINNTTTYGQAITKNAKGLATGTHINILGTTKWITTVTYYDEKARPVYIGNKNDLLITTDIQQIKLDFVSKPLKVRSSHKKDTNTEIVTLDTYTYDHAGRLLTQRQCIGTTNLLDTCGDTDTSAQEVETLSSPITQSQTVQAIKTIWLRPGFVARAITPLSFKASIGTAMITAQPKSELIVSNSYNELGQLITKKVGNSLVKPLQSVDFKYNIRGWLTQINNPSSISTDLFAFELKYNTPTLGAVPLYNGNISQSQWKTANTDTSLKNYNYNYDALNRLKGAVYKNTTSALHDKSYAEYLNYDKNGNINFLQRSGDVAQTFNLEWMDMLNYTYSGNQLQKVVDTGHSTEGFNDQLTIGSALNDYSYDVNGNMTTDRNKDITSISYNHLNLPTQINFGAGTNKITYTYSATGQKQSKSVTNNGVTTITQYAGAYTYEKIGTAANTLQYIAQPEGYVYKTTAGAYQYAYQYKDHLGNIRLSYTDSNKDGVVTSSEIIEENNYYPFGMKHKGYNAVVNSTGNANAQKIKYNGKEYQDELGLNMTAMDFRQYDNALGRFMSIDALAETAYCITPNHFGYNNPIYWADPSGLISQSAVDAIWNNSANNASTTWTNNGGGNFDSSSGNGWVNADSGTFNEYSEMLPEVTVYKGNGDKRNGDIIRGHVYWNSKYYKGFRDDQFSKQIDDTQGMLDYVGAVPVLGEIFDGINAGLSALRGNYGHAGLSLAAMIPIVGNVATGDKVLKPLGLGSTGRTMANNLVEQMTMKAVIENPQLAVKIMDNMQDPRWLGWAKMEYKVKTAEGINAVVHYVGHWEDGILKAVDDFKFKE